MPSFSNQIKEKKRLCVSQKCFDVRLEGGGGLTVVRSGNFEEPPYSCLVLVPCLANRSAILDPA